MPMISRINKDEMEPKTYNLFVAIVFAMDQIKFRYESIEKEICSGYRSDTSQMLALGWDILDWAVKLRKLLLVGRGIKKSDYWFKAIITELDTLTDARNFIQHFDREVNKPELIDMTVMGELHVRLTGKHHPNLGVMIYNAQGGVDSLKMTGLMLSNRNLNYDLLSMSGDVIDSAIIKLGGSTINLRHLVYQVGHARHG
ncbi:MAG: hypothetical protein VXY99_16225, partial [Pseudomonadota bacterium]|nr:hypothetical protein [Pseudomonadota bacterium]